MCINSTVRVFVKYNRFVQVPSVCYYVNYYYFIIMLAVYTTYAGMYGRD